MREAEELDVTLMDDIVSRCSSGSELFFFLCSFFGRLDVQRSAFIVYLRIDHERSMLHYDLQGIDDARRVTYPRLTLKDKTILGLSTLRPRHRSSLG